MSQGQVDMYGRPVPPAMTRAEVLRLVLFVAGVLAVVAALFAVLVLMGHGVSGRCMLDGCE